jgi:hypothetical protein
MALMFEAVPHQIGWVQSAETTEWLKEKFKSSDRSICQLWCNLRTDDCLDTKEKLLRLYQLDLFESIGYDKDTGHTFTQFQMIFSFTITLNQLLERPFPETNMMTLQWTISP